MITHRRVNNDICTEHNNVRYINYDTQEYKNKINSAMENERVTQDLQDEVKANADKFECFNAFLNKKDDFDWQDNGKWDYLKDQEEEKE